MQLMPISMCQPGMRLGRNIYSEDGTVLLAENVELTRRLLDKLYEYGIDYLYIRDSRTDDIQIHQVRQLADLVTRGKTRPAWMDTMAKKRRKTLILCGDCHRSIHATTSSP